MAPQKQGSCRLGTIGRQEAAGSMNGREPHQKTESALAPAFPLGTSTGRLLVLPPVDCISVPKQQAQGHKHTYLMKALQSTLLLANSEPQLASSYYIKRWMDLLHGINSLTESLGDSSLLHFTQNSTAKTRWFNDSHSKCSRWIAWSSRLFCPIPPATNSNKNAFTTQISCSVWHQLEKQWNIPEDIRTVSVGSV